MKDIVQFISGHLPLFGVMLNSASEKGELKVVPRSPFLLHSLESLNTCLNLI